MTKLHSNQTVRRCKVCQNTGIENCTCEVFKPDGERND